MCNQVLRQQARRVSFSQPAAASLTLSTPKGSTAGFIEMTLRSNPMSSQHHNLVESIIVE
jgi:hypothetical protein